ncbi:hypothetical protein [Microtetraspora glauca]|uniref:Uncharacterized protein n=1 Tax=Microtetraspora glauca TaxID=1996 RepID=A0ABV3G9U6_MICGL
MTSALPIASSRQKWASASGDSAGSSSPPAWATATSASTMRWPRGSLRR